MGAIDDADGIWLCPDLKRLTLADRQRVARPLASQVSNSVRSEAPAGSTITPVDVVRGDKVKVKRFVVPT